LDSATQFVLGACVGAAVLGPRIGPRKAVILGGLLGTVPDLDVYYPYETAIDSFTLHRGPTHSLIVQAAATPIFGEALLRLFRWLERKKEHASEAPSRLRLYVAVYLIFATHAILDAITVYGTKLFWPILPDPVGAGSLFIIDPLYTLPLMIVTVWALFCSRWTRSIRKGVLGALLLSSLYVGWSGFAQNAALSRAVDVLGPARGIENARAIPTPFNTVFWRVIVLDGDRYLNVYVPLLGSEDDVTVYAHPRNLSPIVCPGLGELIQVLRFSRGFVRMDIEEDRSIVSDLRMGLTPDYVFRFAVVPGESQALRVEEERNVQADLDWLWNGIRGHGVTRPSESESRIDPDMPWPEFVFETPCTEIPGFDENWTNVGS